MQLNARWHSALPRIGDYWICNCYGAEYHGIYYAIAMWSHPSARNIDQDHTLELRRFAIGPDAPKNTASRMLAIMARIIKRKMPHITRLISYQDTEVHRGIIYSAAGWREIHKTKGDNWVRENRRRPSSQSTAIKIRWEKEIKEKS